MSEISFSKKYPVREPCEEDAYAIPHSDWIRLKLMISQICPERRTYIIASSIFFGIFASAILSVFSIYATKTDAMPAWVIPAGWAITFSSLALGVGFWLIDSQQKKVIAISSQMVVEEMKQVELRYLDSKNLE